MKLLGQFNRNVGLQYQSLLEEAGVDVIIEDWSNSFELTAGIALVRLLVSEQDYERSVNLIREFESNSSKVLTGGEDKTVRKQLFIVLFEIGIRVVIILGIIIAIFFCIKYYNIHASEKFYRDGLADFDRGNYAQALLDFNKSLQIDPYQEQEYVNRGATYYKLGNLPQAIDDFSQAIIFNPQDIIAYNNRGRIYEKNGELFSAYADFTKSIELNPGYARSYVGLAHVFFDEKEYEKAWFQVHKAEGLGYKPDKAYLEFLEKLKEASGRDK